MNNVNYKYTFIILNYEQSRERENKNKFMTWFCILINQFFFSIVGVLFYFAWTPYIYYEWTPHISKNIKMRKMKWTIIFELIIIHKYVGIYLFFSFSIYNIIIFMCVRCKSFKIYIYNLCWYNKLIYLISSFLFLK